MGIPMSKRKVFVIGLDGATFDLIVPWVEEGKLPNIASLMQEGMTADLQSTIPPLTGPAWTSFMTGKNPGTTGVFDFLHRRIGTYELENPDIPTRENKPLHSGMITEETLFDILSGFGKRLAIVNVPVTYPARKLNGIVVSGMLTPSVHSQGFCYPTDIFEKYGYKKDAYILRPKVLVRASSPRFPKMAFDAVIEMIRIRTNFSLRLMKEEEWDFFMTHFIATDYAAHAFWKYIDPNSSLYRREQAERYDGLLLEVYKACDKAIGDLISLAGNETTVVIMSDHGFGPTTKIRPYILIKYSKKWDL